MNTVVGIIGTALAIVWGIMKWYAGKAKDNEQEKQEIHDGVHSDSDSDFLDQF